MTSLVGTIADVSQEQSQGIKQITQALQQIDRVTQSNTANAEQSAAAAEVLSSQATQLKQMLSKFKLKGNAFTSISPVEDVTVVRETASFIGRLGWRSGFAKQLGFYCSG